MGKPCFDDSCDGKHCSVCGGHFADFYQSLCGGLNAPDAICSSCQCLSEEEQAEVRAEYDRKWNEIYGSPEPATKEKP